MSAPAVVPGPGAGVEPLPTPLAADARTADLGDHLAAVPTGRPSAVQLLPAALRFRWPPGPVLHLFERGALLVRPGREVVVVPGPALRPCDWGLAERVLESPVPVGSRGMVVRDADGRRLLGLTGPAIEEVAATAAEFELPRARAELAAGHPVRFGPIVLTGAGLRTGDQELGWSSIGRLTLTSRHVVVSGGPESSPLARVPRRRTPHQRVLLVLAGERIAAARESG